MNTRSSYSSQCFCGAVQFELEGSPEVMAYCHCDDCRHWSAGPISAFTLWNPESLSITHGAENVEGYDRSSAKNGGEIVSLRKWCKVCGGHLYSEHPGMGLFDVPSALIQGLQFEPSFHVHYQKTVLPVKDGLPKFKDLPEEAGGSGELIAE